MADAAIPHPPEARPFAAWLQEHTNGSLHAELTDAIREVVKAVQEHGKGGALTLTVKVAPVNADGPAMFVQGEVKTKLPEGDRPKALFFADEQGNLSRRDPRQPELPLREVPSTRKAG